MKKLICFILSVAILLSVSTFAFAKQTKENQNQITLAQLLETDEANIKSVTFTANESTVAVDKSVFYALADSIKLTSNVNPETTELNGLYIWIEKNDGTRSFAFVTEDGSVDKYGLMMSRLPCALYTTEELTKVTNLFALAHQPKIIKTSDWASGDIAQAEDLQLIPEDLSDDLTQNITRETFCELAYNMLNKADKIQLAKDESVENASPFTDTNNEKTIALGFAGIITGKGEGIFSPNDSITREEAATILYRMANYMNMNTDIKAEIEYIDDKTISNWAREAVYAVSAIDIMQSNGAEFAPQENYTIEQSIATIVRLYDAYIESNSNLQGDDQPKDAATFAEKLNVQMPTDKNYMFSPLSIKMALALAANGAEGETKNEILSATGIRDLDAFNQSSKEQIEKYAKTDILSLNIANSIWINKSKTNQSFDDSYKNKIADFYNGEANAVDSTNAVKTINDWVNRKTNEKIPTIIQDSNFWAMLINAIYFKGAWENEFYEGATEKAEFTDRSGNKAKIDFMNRTGYMNYFGNNEIQIAELPYKNRVDRFSANGEYLDTDSYKDIDVSMYLLMGTSKVTDAESLLKNHSLSNTYVQLSMPKFKIECETTLNAVLKNMGIQKAFTETAEFQPMFDSGNMYITDTIHKTFITVDEKGTEAAAVTAIGMTGTSLPPQQPVVLNFNKPFTFVIRDNTNGEILFMGEYAFAN